MSRFWRLLSSVGAATAQEEVIRVAGTSRAALFLQVLQGSGRRRGVWVRYLLAEDVEPVMRWSGDQWDLLKNAPAGPISWRQLC